MRGAANRKYIVGGINALASGLLGWFDQLYGLRCDYAHKGFVLRDDHTLALIMDGCGSFGFKFRARSFNEIDCARSVHAA